MYQYSLEWFIRIFLNSIANAEASGMWFDFFSETFRVTACQAFVHISFYGRLVHDNFSVGFIFFTDNLEKRIVNINDYFTFSLYSNVCRSLFEKDKLLFSFLVCVRILMNDNKINMVSTDTFTF